MGHLESDLARYQDQQDLNTVLADDNEPDLIESVSADDKSQLLVDEVAKLSDADQDTLVYGSAAQALDVLATIRVFTRNAILKYAKEAA